MVDMQLDGKTKQSMTHYITGDIRLGMVKCYNIYSTFPLDIDLHKNLEGFIIHSDKRHCKSYVKQVFSCGGCGDRQTVCVCVCRTSGLHHS